MSIFNYFILLYILAKLIFSSLLLNDSFIICKLINGLIKIIDFIITLVIACYICILVIFLLFFMFGEKRGDQYIIRF